MKPCAQGKRSWCFCLVDEHWNAVWVLPEGVPWGNRRLLSGSGSRVQPGNMRTRRAFSAMSSLESLSEIATFFAFAFFWSWETKILKEWSTTMRQEGH